MPETPADPPRRRYAAVATYVVVAVLALFVIGIGAVAATQPGCRSCHDTGRFARESSRTEHAKIACTSCHGGTSVDARVDFALQQVFGMTLRTVDVDPTTAHVGSARCRSCHADVNERDVDVRGLKIRHRMCAVGRSCTDCHSATAHGKAVSWPRTVTMEKCFDCHGANGITKKCDSCHTEKRPLDRIKTGVFAVTHGPNWQKTHGMAGMNTCAACHTAAKCSSCHGSGLPHDAGFIKEHSKAAASRDAKCTGCHKPSFCSDCHGLAMPHPSDFTKGHSKLVKTTGEKTCLKCHEKADCTTCHEMHVHPTTLEELGRLGVTPGGR